MIVHEGGRPNESMHNKLGHKGYMDKLETATNWKLRLQELEIFFFVEKKMKSDPIHPWLIPGYFQSNLE